LQVETGLDLAIDMMNPKRYTMISLSAKLMKTVILFFLSVVLLLGALSVYSDPDTPKFYEVRAGSMVFTVEAAITPAEKQLGLMNRARLGQDRGLLMIFNREYMVPIWMKNMLIPLDVVWISASGVVVDRATLPICRRAHCQSYVPSRPASYVLEVAAGKFPLNIGDRVEIIGASGDSLLPPESGIIAPQVKF
jgi:uncharacterized membrane protein (UPF0127 family)